MWDVQLANGSLMDAYVACLEHRVGRGWCHLDIPRHVCLPWPFVFTRVRNKFLSLVGKYVYLIQLGWPSVILDMVVPHVARPLWKIVQKMVNGRLLFRSLFTGVAFGQCTAPTGHEVVVACLPGLVWALMSVALSLLHWSMWFGVSNCCYVALPCSKSS